MAEVPRDLDQILPTAAERAVRVAAELERLRRDLDRAATASGLSDEAKREGLALLTAARDSLQALPE